MIDEGDHRAIEAYANQGGNISSNGWLVEPPLFYALELGQKDCFSTLLKANADWRVTTGRYRHSVICRAAGLEDSFWLKELLKYGADPNFNPPRRNSFSDITPMINAIQNFQFENLKILVEAGCDIEFAGDDLTTPLSFAAGNGQFQMVEYLLHKGADYRRRLPADYSFARNMRSHLLGETDFYFPGEREALVRVAAWLAERGIDYQETRMEGNFEVFVEH